MSVMLTGLAIIFISVVFGLAVRSLLNESKRVETYLNERGIRNERMGRRS